MPKKPAIRTVKKIWMRAKAVQPTKVHELKITLRGSKPPIWRRVAVPSDIRLSNLHWVIQIVMGWGNYHLHQFIVPDYRPKPTRGEMQVLGRSGQWEKLAGYMRRDRYWSNPQFELEEAEDESNVKLSELAPEVKSKFIYEYDFGDGWEHEVKVVKIGPPTEGIKYPICLAGKLACPPDDSGGIWGYYDMLEVLKDPKHEDYKDTREWIGKNFDPERFNLEKVNAGLAKLR